MKKKKHPRDNKGRFTFKDYVGMDIKELKSITQKEYRQNTKYEQILMPTITERLPKKKENKPVSKDEFFGVEFKGYKGADAVEKLLREKKGHIKNAFYHKEFGYITLAWGDDNGGLKHAIKRRDEDKANGINDISGLEMARKIPDIIKYGVKVKDKQGRDNIEFDIYRVGIKKTYDNDKITWVVSAMENLEKKKKLAEN